MRDNKKYIREINNSLKFLPNYTDSEIENEVSQEIGIITIKSIGLHIELKKKKIFVLLAGNDLPLVYLIRKKNGDIPENDTKYCKDIEEIKAFILNSDFI